MEFLFLLVFVAVILLWWSLTSARCKEQTLIADKRRLLNSMWEMLNLRVEAVHPYESEEPEVQMGGHEYTEGDAIVGPQQNAENTWDNETPFSIAEITHPKGGETVWKVRIVDYETMGDLFTQTLVFDDNEQRVQIRQRFEKMKLKVQGIRSRDDELQVKMNGKYYANGTTIGDSPFLIVDVWREAESKLWRVEVVDEDTSGEYFEETLTYREEGSHNDCPPGSDMLY